MVQYYPKNPKTIPSSDSDTDHVDPDPGLEIVERNRRERMQRQAEYTKEELEKVLQRVDNVIKSFIFVFVLISLSSLDDE